MGCFVFHLGCSSNSHPDRGEDLIPHQLGGDFIHLIPGQSPRFWFKRTGPLLGLSGRPVCARAHEQMQEQLRERKKRSKTLCCYPSTSAQPAPVVGWPDSCDGGGGAWRRCRRGEAVPAVRGGGSGWR
jgi:hypothetical protein